MDLCEPNFTDHQLPSFNGDLRQALSQGKWPSLLHSGSNPSNDALTVLQKLLGWLHSGSKDVIVYIYIGIKFSFQGKPHSKCWTNLP